MAALLRPSLTAAALLAATPVRAAADPVPAAIDNPYGLGALWAQGDVVARATLLFLLLMSAVTWYLLATKLMEQRQLLRHARQARALFLGTGTETLPPGNPLRAVVAQGRRAVDQHGQALEGRVDLHTWVTIAIERALSAVGRGLHGGMAALATIASTAPFVGLFGTVWGIYHALTAIGVAGQASIDKVAGPVGEALIMTALGLAVAVPAVLGYNGLARRNRLAAEALKDFGGDLHAALLGGMPAEGRDLPGPRPHVARAAG